MPAVPREGHRDLAESLRAADDELREGRTTSLADLRGYVPNGHRLIEGEVVCDTCGARVEASGLIDPEPCPRAGCPGTLR